MVFVLIRAFQFDMSVPLEDVKSKSAVVRRPYLASDPEKGSQMPLWVSSQNSLKLHMDIFDMNFLRNTEMVLYPIMTMKQTR